MCLSMGKTSSAKSPEPPDSQAAKNPGRKPAVFPPE
ncbi:hypothetical protein BACCAP_02867 [Pseudoflavonifractor capillosus ATCC 29799]|uniref:Uncharacterized protein n=1 Tax=Pseudoflavonifractor capillosus ATCC 29799 TaxID=411467 RepID=A6NXC2_9FIRM|nr:hypothetical protein BACCAP_02867 [Pseudoflavonifractor capillosus ATCC 29799]